MDQGLESQKVQAGSIYLSIYLSTYLPIYLSTYLPIYLSTYLPIYLPIYLSTYLLPLGLSRINRPEVVSHLRARSVSYRF